MIAQTLLSVLLGGVLVRTLGLTGLLVLVAVLLACVFGGVMFWIRSRGD